MRGLETTTLGKYELIREIGYGSMGTVYLARDLFLHRDVAIKVANPTTNDDARRARRRRKLFFNEAQAAGMLRHPNIVATIDAGIEGELRYLVMEYVPGAETLGDFCQPDRLLAIDLVVDLVLKCAVALDFAHSKGVIHRDIKPANIIVTADREVKIADFGIALMTGDEVEQTQVVGMLGSPRYMAPEQVYGETITNQSDIFSLGIVLYELLTGTSPFAARTLALIGQNIGREAHKPLLEVRPEIPTALARIVDRTLKKHPAGRYSNAMDLAGDLSLVYDELKLTEKELIGPQRFEKVKGLSFFADFAEADIFETINASTWARHKAGTHIIEEGVTGESFYILISGTVSVVRNRSEVDTLTSGTSFGEIGYLTSGRRTASIIAKTNVVVMKVQADLIRRASASSQLRFQHAFLKTLTARLANAMQYIEDST